MVDDCRQILEQVERHLRACGPCHDHSDFQQHVKDLLRAKCGCDEVPADLLGRIRAGFSRPAP